jgi:hypothetical protein
MRFDRKHRVIAVAAALQTRGFDVRGVREDASAASLTRALNELQAFNIIPDDLSVNYVHGRFYAPSLKFGKHFHSSNFAVGHCLYPSRTMRETPSEKGRFVVLQNGIQALENGRHYDPESLFGLVDGWGGGMSEQPGARIAAFDGS